MELLDIRVFGPLFEDVQLQRIFPDGKTFVDCKPKMPAAIINEKYAAEKTKDGFSLKEFVNQYFEMPVPHSSGYSSDTQKSAEENIEQLWEVLTRNPDKESGTLIPLPYSYIVPGGRFGEIYYWDSYFTLLGLKASGKDAMIENMVKNFSYLIENLGYIPNGNRSYFIGRSQPPFYSLMVKLLSEVKGPAILITYLPQLEKEYQFWMNGTDQLNDTLNACNRVVKLLGGEILNRYWDANDTARPESYREDIELFHQSTQPATELFRHLRAGAESGWDFSSRWFRQAEEFTSIHTADIIPVDLNCLLYHLEQLLAVAHQLNNDPVKATAYSSLALQRKKAIHQYCWNEEEGFFMDYVWKHQEQTGALTLAGVSPLFFAVADEEQALSVSAVISEKFLAPGGVVTTLETTGQQWDAPNGWAPLQWMTIKGLENYGETELATTIAKRWIQLNTAVFKRTGKLMEKYNVIDTHLEAGGGEYEGQDGFGWTNGVLLALIRQYGAAD